MSLALQSDGKILIGGYFNNFYTNGGVIGTARSSLARLNTDGTVDAGFTAHANSGVTAIFWCSPIVRLSLAASSRRCLRAARPRPRTVVASRGSIRTARLDATFDPSTNQQVIAMALQSDGKIILVGGFTTLQPNGAANWTQRNYIARVNTDGTLDTTFDPNANGQVRALILQATARFSWLVASRPCSPSAGTPITVSLPIARLNANGTVDTGFFVSAGGQSARR